MDFNHILEDINSMIDAVRDGEYMRAWELQIELETHALEIAKFFLNPKSKKKMMGDQSDILGEVQEKGKELMIVAAEKRAELACEPVTMKAGDTKAAIGDGKILDIILLVLPYILKLFG